jgi:YidC/Oxa1 family membrane protein insertase
VKDQNDRRLFMAVAVSLVIITAWQYFFMPPIPPEESAAAVVSPAGPGSETAPVAPSPPVPSAVEVACTGTSAAIRSGGTELEVSDCGAVRSIRFPDVLSPRTVTGWWSWALDAVQGRSGGGWQAYTGGEQALDLLHDGEFLAAGRGEAALGGTWAVVGTDPLVQRRTTPDGLTITRTITRGEGSLWSATIRFEGDRPLVGPFWVAVAAAPVEDANPTLGTDPLVSVTVDGDLETLTATAFPTPQALEGPVSWFGVGDRYHLAAAAPEAPAGASVAFQQFGKDRVGVRYTLPAEGLSPGSPVEAKFLLYTGPRELGALERAGHGLDEAASLGWFGLFAKFMLITLHLIQGVLGNWGFSILALTLLVRLATYPLTRSALVSGRKMQALQPHIKALQEKYADDREAMSREQMALFAKHGVNPVGGCLPMLVQMPIFFALYSALAYEPSLYNAEFFYLKDLSAQDPYGLLPAFVVAGMFVQQRITPITGMDETQARILKFMPLVFGLMMWSAPAGLSLYYSLNTVLAIAQQWYNTRSLPPIVPVGAPDVAT